MMQKANGLIALLLIAAIILFSFGNSPENGQGAVSLQTVCGDTAVQSDTAPHEDNENEAAKIIAAVVIVIIVIFIVYCITGAETTNTDRR